jgi:uncharacterized membrane protein
MSQTVGALLIGLGLVNILAKDLVWELTVFGNRLEGEESERTPLWDVWTTLGGAILVVIGIVVTMQN